MNATTVIILSIISFSVIPAIQGQPAAATGTVTIIGNDSIVPPTGLYDFGYVTVGVSAAGTVSTPYGNIGSSPSIASDLAASLCTAINSTAGISAVVKCTGTSGPTVKLAAQFAGVAGNGITLGVSAQSLLPQSNQSAFSGSTTSGVLSGGSVSQPQTRSFQMALWESPHSPPIDADLAFFTEGDAQPDGRSIFAFSRPWVATNATAAFNGIVSAYAQSGHPIDFSRVLAVVIDEPYWKNIGTPDWTNPCADSRQDAVTSLRNDFRQLAAAVHNAAPRVRFWINFSEPEIQWMMAGCTLNDPSIDVISFDKYFAAFPGPCNVLPQQPAQCVQPYYDWIMGHRSFAGQQMALVPGAFIRIKNGAPGTPGTPLDNTCPQPQCEPPSLLGGFVSYANAMNRNCNMPLGSLGATGNFDKCPVWILVGFLGQNCIAVCSSADSNIDWHGVLDTDQTYTTIMQPLKQEWQTHFHRQPVGALVTEIVNGILN